ncbi:MAG TPA: YggT family protein [Clostridiaceae bacterium]|nr:YggT family protein [Clostridiaceae bacterium]
MFNTILLAVNYLLLFIQYAILARAVISWLPISRDNSLVRLLFQITEPILAPIRNFIMRSMAGRSIMIDFSPVIAFIFIGIIRNVLFRIF